MFAVIFLKKFIVWIALIGFIATGTGCASNNKTNLALIPHEQMNTKQDVAKLESPKTYTNRHAADSSAQAPAVKSTQVKFKEIYGKYNSHTENVTSTEKNASIDTAKFLVNNRSAIERYQKYHAPLEQQHALFMESDCIDEHKNAALYGRNWHRIEPRKNKLPPATSNANIRSFFYNRSSLSETNKRGLMHTSEHGRLTSHQLLSPTLFRNMRNPTTTAVRPCVPKPSVWAKNSSTNPTQTGKKSQFNHLITQAALRHQVDEKLVHAVIQTESAYNANATSSAGAVGLMQLMPGTAKQYGVTDRNDPDQNINGGTRYLRYLLDLFNSNMDLAVAAYNAGEHTVMKYHNSIPPYPETRNYVRQVLSLYNR